jgi:CRP/FNR family transcriptional regulator
MNSFLQSLSSDLRSQLTGFCVSRGFGEDQCIFSEGETATFLPIVSVGRVKLVRHPTDGKEVIIGIFKAGEVFAIPPALDGKRFPATAIAMEKSELLLLERREFTCLMKESEEFSTAILGQMCGLLRDRTASVQIHSTLSSEVRVAQVLLGLAYDSRQDWPVRIALRRQDIAEIAGLTTETTIRTIRKLAGKGLVRIERGKILIDSCMPLAEFVK